MNFVGPGDFLYVDGDLSSIEIDNDIMPVRSGARKREIRGMDIAFLMEAVEERARFAGLDPMEEKFAFSRCITLEQVNAIIDRYNEMRLCFVNGSDRHIYGQGLWDESYKDADVLYRNGNTGAYNYDASQYYKTLNEISNVTDDCILQEKVFEIFDELEKVCFVSMNFAPIQYDEPIWSGKSITTEHISGTDDRYSRDARSRIVSSISNSNDTLAVKSKESGVSVTTHYDYYVGGWVTSGSCDLNQSVKTEVKDVCDFEKSFIRAQVECTLDFIHYDMFFPLIDATDRFGMDEAKLLDFIYDCYGDYHVVGQRGSFEAKDRHNSYFLGLRDRTRWDV